MSTRHDTSDAVIPADLYRPFGRTGMRVSPLGFGGSPIGNLGSSPEAVATVLHALLDRGVNLIDTAHAYHESEALIGAAIAGRRDDVVLVTKCGSKWGEDDLPDAWTPEYVRATIDRSLRRLRTDHVDVMLLHSCDLQTLQRGDVLAEVIAARDAGKVRFVGYSGDNEAAAWAAAQPDVSVIQTSVSICDQKNIDDVLPAATASDVGIMAKRPVANGAWKSCEDQYDRYRRYAAPYVERFEAMSLDLEALCASIGARIDWPELTLRFTLSIPGVHTAIVGTTRRESALANVAAASRGPLPADVVDTIRRAFRAVDPGTWPGLT